MIALPQNAEQVVRIMKGVAFLESILAPEWESRYYSFNSKWSQGEMMTSMRNGQGSQWFGLITQYGVALTGGIAGIAPTVDPFSKLPSVFENNFRKEPAFLTNDSIFGFSILNSEVEWTKVYSGSVSQEKIEALFDIISEDPRKYQDFANWYYHRKIDLQDISKALRNEEFRKEDLLRLNSEISLDELQQDIEEIGYGKSIEWMPTR